MDLVALGNVGVDLWETKCSDGRVSEPRKAILLHVTAFYNGLGTVSEPSVITVPVACEGSQYSGLQLKLGRSRSDFWENH